MNASSDAPTAADIARQILMERGHVMLEQPSPPIDVVIRRRNTAILATVIFSDVTRYDVAIKSVSNRLGGILRCAEQFARVHERVRSISPRIAQAVPRILGWEVQSSLIVMEYIYGPTLAEVVPTGLLGTGDDERYLSPIRRAGQVLAEMHAISTNDVQLEGFKPRTNGSFVPVFESQWYNLGLYKYVPRHWHCPSCISEWMEPSFEDRIAQKLVPVDTQPKNTLTPSADKIYYIDPDYNVGNPALGLAQFLVGFDHLGIVRPYLAANGRLAYWQGAFLRAYEEHAPPAVMHDLRFFYPFVLHVSCGQHMERRPRLKAYLRWYYGSRLSAYLESIKS